MSPTTAAIRIDFTGLRCPSSLKLHRAAVGRSSAAAFQCKSIPCSPRRIEYPNLNGLSFRSVFQAAALSIWQVGKVHNACVGADGSTPNACRLGSDGHNVRLSSRINRSSPCCPLLVGLVVCFLHGLAHASPGGHLKTLLPSPPPDRLHFFLRRPRAGRSPAAGTANRPRLRNTCRLLRVHLHHVDQLLFADLGAKSIS